MSDRLILYDGDCPFCQWSVQFILKRDKKADFMFASLDSPLGQQLRQVYQIPETTDSLLLIENNRAYMKSTAALRIAKRLHLLYPLLALFLIIPRPVRDSIYDAIARQRKQIPVGKNVCRLPTPEESKRFLE